MTPRKREEPSALPAGPEPAAFEELPVVEEPTPQPKRVMVVFQHALSGGLTSANSTDKTKELEVVYDKSGWPRGVIVFDKRSRRKYTVPLSNISELCEF